MKICSETPELLQIDQETGGKILIDAPQGYERALYEHKNVTACNERDITSSAFQLLTLIT
jgi:hypothetical protein